MNFCNQIKRLERLDYLCRSRSTGTPAELARKLSLSKSQVYQVIKSMKQDLGAPIYYSRTHQSYIYNGNKRFICSFSDDNNPEQ